MGHESQCYAMTINRLRCALYGKFLCLETPDVWLCNVHAEISSKRPVRLFEGGQVTAILDKWVYEEGK